MITKTLIIITIILAITPFLLELLGVFEVEVIDTVKSTRKHPFYIGDVYYSPERQDYRYAYETTNENGETIYVYEKRAIKPKGIFAKLAIYKENIYALAMGIGIIAIFMLLLFVGGNYKHQQRLAVLKYQREYVETLNNEVETIVETYMKHEEITFDRNVSLEALVITHPELRSVELVHSQLETLKYEKERLNTLEINILKYENFRKWFGL